MVQFHQFQVVGRALPTESDEHPKIYRMKLWATNEVRAKSKFWCVLVDFSQFSNLIEKKKRESVFDRRFLFNFVVDENQVLLEEAEEGQEEQRSDACYQRGKLVNMMKLSYITCLCSICLYFGFEVSDANPISTVFV